MKYVKANQALIVDDEAPIREMFRDIAEQEGYAVAEAESSRSLSAALDNATPSVIFLDLTMPESDGIELLRDLARVNFTAPVILVSGQDKRVLNTAQRFGRMLGLTMPAVLSKPVPIKTISEILKTYHVNEDELSVEDIKIGIKNDEFVLAYQPKVSLPIDANFNVLGGEALVRWNHPQRGRINPDDFIPLAEKSGIIGEITDMVLDKALLQMSLFERAGVTVPIAVNISRHDLTDLSFPDRLAAKLSAHKIEPQRLVLEVTEQAVMEDVYAATETLTRLRLKDISVSLDDFGAGYSSMVELYRMPLSELKIDRSLVADIDVDPGAKSVLKAIKALAGELSIPVCVEGIETASAAKFLASIGFETGQGYYFARPLSAELFAKLALKNQKVDASSPVEKTSNVHTISPLSFARN